MINFTLSEIDEKDADVLKEMKILSDLVGALIKQNAKLAAKIDGLAVGKEPKVEKCAPCSCASDE